MHEGAQEPPGIKEEAAKRWQAPESCHWRTSLRAVKLACALPLPPTASALPPVGSDEERPALSTTHCQ